MLNEELDKINAAPLYFVIGKERSGTTLLQVMLNAHSNIVAPPESRFIIMLYLKYGLIKKWKEKNIKAFCDELFVENIFRNYWNIDKAKLYNFLVGLKERLNYPLLCKIVFYHFAPTDKDIKIFIDKNILYYFFIPELTKMFPDAKFIHIVRDYRANIISHGRVITVKQNTADMAYRWMRVNELIEKNKTLLPGRWFTLKYESLVTDPEVTMKQICTFIGVTFDRCMIENHNKKLFPSFYEKSGEAEFKKYHHKMFEPISTAFIEEWKDKMSKKDQAIAENIAGPFAERMYGYKLYSENKNFTVNSIQLLLAKLKYGAMMWYFRKLLQYRFVFYSHRYVVRHILSTIKN